MLQAFTRQMAVLLVVAAGGMALAGPETSPAKVSSELTLAADFAKVYQQFEAVAEVLKNEAYHGLKNEEVSLWSCGDQAGHILLAAQMMRGGIQATLDNPSANAEGTVNEQGRAILRMGTFPRGIAQAPEGLRPEGKSRAEFLELLEEEKKAWKALEEQSDALKASKGRSPHPALGMLNGPEWVRFVTIHSAHHLAIVRDILKESGNMEFGKNLHEKEDAGE